jgi:hypothetical protein
VFLVLAAEEILTAPGLLPEGQCRDLLDSATRRAWVALTPPWTVHPTEPAR